MMNELHYLASFSGLRLTKLKAAPTARLHPFPVLEQ